MSVADWNRRTKALFPLAITVEDYEGYDEFGDPDTFLVIKIGDTEIWRETPNQTLYWDVYGDGGPGLNEAVINKVGEILGNAITRANLGVGGKIG